MSTVKSESEQRGPVKVFRQGAVAASVWQRENEGGSYFEFSLSRSWKSRDGLKEGYSPNFYASNEAEIATVVQDACLWIAAQPAGGDHSAAADATSPTNVA